MKRLIPLLIAAFAVLCFSSCQSGESTPVDVATKAIKAIQKGDYKAYVSTFNLTSEEQKQMTALIEDKVSKAIEEKGGIESFTITDSEIDEEDGSAEVTANLFYKDGSDEDQVMNFIKVNDEWKQEMNK